MKLSIAKTVNEMTRTATTEKGFVLILALVAMVAMSIIGISLVMNMTTDMQLAANERESKQAFQLAEAGVNEAIARLQIKKTAPNYAGEPSGTTGYRTTATALKNPNFTSVEGLGYTVKLEYLIETSPFCDSNSVGVSNASTNLTNNADGTPATQNCSNEVVMYGRDFNVPVESTTVMIGTFPAYKITSVGTSGTTTKTIEAYIGKRSINNDPGAAGNSNSCITLSGGKSELESETAGIPGAIYLAGCVAPPGKVIGDGCNGVAGANSAKVEGGCQTKAVATNLDTYLGDTVAKIGAQASTKIVCASQGVCNAEMNAIPATTGVWGTCGNGSTDSQLVYVNNPIGISVNLTSASLPSGCGRGILIVTGDLAISGNAKYEGLVYVLGSVTLNGNAQVVGGIMAGGTIKVNGGGTDETEVEYNPLILQQVADALGSSISPDLMLWRRL